LYDGVLMALGYFTWRYALSTGELRVVYSELGRSTELAVNLERTQQESIRKSQFLNALSHDLRTPLNGLGLQAQVAEMAMRSGDQAALTQAIRDIQASTRATATMLDTLLECSRADFETDRDDKAQFKLDDLVRDVAGRFEPAATARGLSLRVKPSNCIVFLDRVKLDRVLSNLVANALKFTPAGGVRIEVDQDALSVEIHVIDTGIGISTDAKDLVFEEFFQLQNNERDPSKGFGLGLSIARRLVLQMGGDINVESAPGKGSRFSIKLRNVVQCADTSGKTAADDDDVESASSLAVAPG
ncbi:MAG: HAMP domain-containing histidine kinase, partial [Phycisphaerae bacterium]|nr:HAMP domain-containing histidine kinase [Phycisphaerae bacterium]